MKRLSLAILLGLLPVAAVIVYVALAATIVCPATGCAPGTGTADADTFIGSSVVDTFEPQGGNDVIYGGAGNDTVPCTVAGVDCTGGNKFFAGGGGDDIFGDGAGAELTGNDKFFGEDGVDTSNIGPGNDYVDCGPGADDCDGFADNDIIIGGPGTDIYTAANNADDDVFVVFFGDAGGVAEDLQCGAGTDVVVFVGFQNQVFTFPVPDAGAGTYTNTTLDCEILVGG